MFSRKTKAPTKQPAPSTVDKATAKQVPPITQQDIDRHRGVLLRTPAGEDYRQVKEFVVTQTSSIADQKHALAEAMAELATYKSKAERDIADMRRSMSYTQVDATAKCREYQEDIAKRERSIVNLREKLAQSEQTLTTQREQLTIENDRLIAQASRDLGATANV